MLMTHSAVFFLQKINDITYAQVLPELELLVLLALVLVLLVLVLVLVLLVLVLVLLVLLGPVPPLLSWPAQQVSFPVPTGSQPA
jgi:hypothetical protein